MCVCNILVFSLLTMNMFVFSRLLVIITLVTLYAVTHLLRYVVDDSSINAVNGGDNKNAVFKGSWLFRLSLNLLGYATIFIPGFLIFKYIKISKYLERSGE